MAADVNDSVVLIEDVARIIGYDQIPVSPQLSIPSSGLRNIADRLRQNVSEHLASAGFFECRNPSLESPNMSQWLGDPADPITLRNWATREMSVLRRSLLSGLATTVQTNVRRGAQSGWFFEVDRIFGLGSDNNKGKTIDAEGMSGQWHVGGIAGGRLERCHWRSDSIQVDFFTLKGVVEDLLERIGARDLIFQPTDLRPFIIGTAADVFLRDNRKLGSIGEIDPQIVAFERVPFRVFAFELNLEALEDTFSAFPVYRQLPRQPAVMRDLAVVVPVTVSYADIDRIIRSTAGQVLEMIRLVDRYQGAQVPPGHQSLAFHMVFRDPERTLTSEEVAETMERVVAALKGNLGAQLRA